MRHMTMLSPVVAPAAVTAPEPQQQRAPVEYGAAVTHRDAVKVKNRVVPSAIAHKKRGAPEARSSDPQTPRKQQRGQYVDIRV